jgi:pyridinium-3,5-biscarboxylic acid mononucleotide synthase
MDSRELEELLKRVRDGVATPEEALIRLRDLPYEDLGFAKVDHHRALRRGFPEVVFGAGKTDEQIARIVMSLVDKSQNVLVTRAAARTYTFVAATVPQAVYHEQARAITVSVKQAQQIPGRVAILAAGTSDLPVAEEAAVTATFNGVEVDRIYDVGVAGLHRLLDQSERLRAAEYAIVVAGMEGALPSVVSGLVDIPVVAVPTSVGYGASLGGFAALLAMLNSCASGISVVNIDNGFGAGYFVSLALRRRVHGAQHAQG